MDTPVLTDKNIIPTDEVVFGYVGKNKTHWIALFEMLKTDYKDFIPEWRYYNDGKSWLMKVTRKSKTIFWLSVIKNGFRVTFYFTDKSKKEILDSNISDELKEQFKDSKKINKIRPITCVIKSKRSIKYVNTLIILKLGNN